MRKLAKNRFSGTLLLGVLFFAAGCGKKEEETPPNYVVQEVYTGKTVDNAQIEPELPEKASADAEPSGALSIIREDIAENFGADAGNSKNSMESTGADAGLLKDDMESAGGDAGITEESMKDGAENTPEPQVGAMRNDQVSVMSVDEMELLPAQTAVDICAFSEEEIKACFYYEEVPDTVFERMKGNSYGEDCTVPLSELRYVRVLHYGFDGAVHIGELVVNQAIAQDIIDIFQELFDAEYPIEKMVLIDVYGGDDDASMADNNTSSFNFRLVEGTTSLSKHAYGLAIDVNPLYNPYIPVWDGVQVVLPENAEAYADREAACDYYIKHGDVCYEAFVSRGFTWGGDWKTEKDYQHFSKVPE